MTATIIVLLMIPFVITTAFFMLATAKRVLASGVKLSKPRLLVCYFWFVVGYVGDWAYNTVIGSIRFREAPKWHRREWLYTARIQRLVFSGSNWRQRIALEEAAMLNAADPRHIKFVAEVDDYP